MLKELFRIVDLHADLPLHVTERRTAGESRVLERYHLEKLRKGSVTAVITPIWVESSYKPSGALRRGLQILEAFEEDIDECPNFTLVRSYQEFLEAEAKEKIGLVLGVEGGEVIEDDLGLLRYFHRVGVRCFGLVWNQRNLMADGWEHPGAEQGLTDFGRQVLAELQRLGIIIDLAHMAPKSFWDVLKITKHPVIVSHTTTIRHRSLRSLTDDQLRAIASNGGLVGIYAVNTGTNTVSVRDLRAYCDHVEHAIKVAGPEHVGLGPDFYDYFLEALSAEYPDIKYQPVVDLEDHTKLGAVLSELHQRGLSDDEIYMISRDNFARILAKVVG